MSKPTLQVVWFKRDLRVEDHRPLANAAACGPVLPLFVVEPELWQQPDASGRQWAFVYECLQELRYALGSLGQPLVVRIGKMTDILERMHSTLGIHTLWSHQETGNAWTHERDLEVKSWCSDRGVPWHQERQGGAIRGLRLREGWAKRWDQFMAEATTRPPPLRPLGTIELGPLPWVSELALTHDWCPGRQSGGRAAALKRLASFLNERGRQYRTAMSSPVTAFDACSRLSPHLAWGTVSMREVAQATRQRQRALLTAPKCSVGPWRGSLSAFLGRLHWHCHFMQKLEDEPRIEFEDLHRAYENLRPDEPDSARLHAWANGETGLPFVDASMRALRATGWMNFRMRAMLMAVASYHLWLDWRKPGQYLARLFTDFEPGIHWPQVQMQSGTTGINAVRIYNPVKQGYDQDPQGLFVRRWVPELAKVPERFIHEPWKWAQARVLIDKTYPSPIVDHLAAAKAARQIIWSIRGGTEFKLESTRIHSKHGSRRSGTTKGRRFRSQR